VVLHSYKNTITEWGKKVTTGIVLALKYYMVDIWKSVAYLEHI